MKYQRPMTALTDINVTQIYTDINIKHVTGKKQITQIQVHKTDIHEQPQCLKPSDTKLFKF